MNDAPAFVLDASALLAYVLDEQGGELIERLLPQRVVISSVNWVEVLSKLADLGRDPQNEASQLIEHSALAATLTVLPRERPA